MQTERVTFLTTPEAKAALAARAAARGISTGEYIRLAVENMPEESVEEQELMAIVGELVAAIPEMRASLERTAARIDESVANVDRKLRAAGVRK